MDPIIISITGSVALAIGLIAGKLIFAKNSKQKTAEAEKQAQKILADAQSTAETLKKEKLLEVKKNLYNSNQNTTRRYCNVIKN